MARDDHDDRDDPVSLGARMRVDPSSEIGEVFDDLEQLLKNPDVVGALAERGLNASLALVAVEGLRAYLAGRKADAADDLRTVAEEIEARLAFSGGGPPADA
jgi:hypothetical protein